MVMELGWGRSLSTTKGLSAALWPWSLAGKVALHVRTKCCLMALELGGESLVAITGIATVLDLPFKAGSVS